MRATAWVMKTKIARFDLCLGSLRSSRLALRLALAIPLLQAGHASLAHFRIVCVECLEIIGFHHSGELDFRRFALGDLVGFRVRRICIAIGSTNEDGRCPVQSGLGKGFLGQENRASSFLGGLGEKLCEG